MISHALTIIRNELNRHLQKNYNSSSSNTTDVWVSLGNLAEGFASVSAPNGLPRERLYLSVVNVKEEETLKNMPNYVRNDLSLTATYENPPVYLNFLILLVAAHSDYTTALTMLSRAIRFFQSKKVFTQDNVDPESMATPTVPIDRLDQLVSFKLILDLHSPKMEEVNHLWGTLGGKQYPFVLYVLRMLDLKFRSVEHESGLITQVVSNFSHKHTTTK